MGFTSVPTETRAAPGTQARPGRRGSGLLFDVGMLLLLAVMSFSAGGWLNVFRSRSIPWVYESRATTLDLVVSRLGESGNRVAVADDPEALPHEIRLDEFQTFVAARRGVVLDARAAVFYREAHVPGALNLPREEFAEEFPRLRAILESKKDGPIAIYCSGADCPDSQLLSEALTKLGYRHLLIYTSGWEEWSQMGLPQEGTAVQP